MIAYDRHQWLKHLFTLRGSVLPVVMPRIMVFVAFSAVVVAAHKVGIAPTIPPSIHAVLGTVLGLMLAFRTNSAYDRWWEARKAWGSITNRARDLCRQALTFLEDDEARAPSVPSTPLRIAKLTAAFAYSAKRALWREHVVPELESLLGPVEARRLSERPGPPHRTLLALGELLHAQKRAGKLSDFEHQLMERNVTDLIDQLGVCQRILRTPVPFAYVVHLRRFLLVYNATLPFALVGDLGYGTPVIMIAIGYAMFGVEETGVRIEDPFTPSPNDIDLDRICRNIERDLMALVGSPQVVPDSVVVQA
jgi:ion channel-forming bestrophin family protein